MPEDKYWPNFRHFWYFIVCIRYFAVL